MTATGMILGAAPHGAPAEALVFRKAAVGRARDTARLVSEAGEPRSHGAGASLSSGFSAPRVSEIADSLPAFRASRAFVE